MKIGVLYAGAPFLCARRCSGWPIVDTGGSRMRAGVGTGTARMGMCVEGEEVGGASKVECAKRGHRALSLAGHRRCGKKQCTGPHPPWRPECQPACSACLLIALPDAQAGPSLHRAAQLLRQYTAHHQGLQARRFAGQRSTCVAAH
ncbi:hypothetical protein FH972_026065 [Carpinus fangiana]|uniref:Uncharacterized protein n=1 Tax=Carpinus fangiana TaxID=176857 RepID=A0A5N6L383_9ROSI|nr:hypothetical protein FH972_026065 [Carpinus fangiana]